jgi:XrtN system VIT domain protein
MQEKEHVSLENAFDVISPIIETQEVEIRFIPWRDPRYIAGLVCIVLSLGSFLLTPLEGKNGLIGNGSFWICHIVTLVFWAIMTFSKKAKTQWFDTKIDYTLQLVVLMQIGAFALNSMFEEVFPPSVLWLQIVLVVHCLTLLSFSLRDWLTENIMFALFFIMGLGFVLDAYFFILTLPLSVIGIAMVWFFGITLYACAPILKVIYEIVFLVKTNAFNLVFKRFFFGGMATAVAAVGIFTFGWVSLVNKTAKALGDNNNPLPTWVRVAQVLPPSVLTEKLLKSEVPTIDNSMFLNFSRLGERIHDPIMIIANWLKPIPQMDDSDRANALKSIFDARTQAEQRLWAGDNIRVEGVKTGIELHPEHRLAYTEKVINLKNIATDQGRWAIEEAIFTFHLPEGGVVTSSSLWVDGEERPAFLTTRGKADSAYKAVVGVERRDPSVVHWQEGNTVTVRVFPCTPELPRQFKLGFTTPLRKSGDKLVYENIVFDGVLADGVTDSLTLNYTEKTENTEGIVFTKKENNQTGKANAQTNWAFTIPCPPLSASVFSFDKKSYQVEEAPPQYEAFDAQEIYLDINAAWTETECNKIIELARGKPVFMCSKTGFVQVTASKNLFDELHDANFSLFPIHKVKNSEKALIITKNKLFSPDFTALKGSLFSKEMSETLPNTGQIRVFCLDNRYSTYFNTLRQMRVINADGGSFDDLKRLVFIEKIFHSNTETASKLNIESAQMSIVEYVETKKFPSLPQPKTPNTDEHLLRLFGYNKILSIVGKNYFQKDYDLKPLADLAEKAYVVSPVTSLIVLETEADYERFGIKKGDKKSLGNAVLKQATASKSGAAPEPTEWLLIGLAFGVILFFIRKQQA